MAKVLIAGEAVVVTSAIKLEDLKKLEKYAPDALILKEENEDGRMVPVFGVCTTNGSGKISKMGIEFGGATHDDEKLATMTMVYSGGGDVKQEVADMIGREIVLLNRIEATIPSALHRVDAEQAAIMENIELV